MDDLELNRVYRWVTAEPGTHAALERWVFTRIDKARNEADWLMVAGPQIGSRGTTLDLDVYWDAEEAWS